MIVIMRGLGEPRIVLLKMMVRDVIRERALRLGLVVISNEKDDDAINAIVILHWQNGSFRTQSGPPILR